MISLNEYNRLKKRVEEVNSEASRAEGALEQQHKRLAEEFDCHSVSEAEKLLKELEKKEAELEKDYQLKLAEFKEEWGDRLE